MLSLIAFLSRTFIFFKLEHNFVLYSFLLINKNKLLIKKQETKKSSICFFGNRATQRFLTPQRARPGPAGRSVKDGRS